VCQKFQNKIHLCRSVRLPPTAVTLRFSHVAHLLHGAKEARRRSWIAVRWLRLRPRPGIRQFLSHGDRFGRNFRQCYRRVVS
jgi:hypothetical protein